MSDLEKKSNDSGEDSDESIATDDLNELQNSLKDSFQEDEAEVVEEISKKAKSIKKPKVPKKNEIVVEDPKPVKRRGRPPKSIEEKLAKQVIKKEKIIYVIQNDDGSFTQKNPEKLGMRELRKIKIEDDAQKTEMEYGKKLARLKSGKPKIPKTRTEAQKKATEKMLEHNRLRRAGKKSEAKIERKAEIKEAVTQSVTEVIQQPAVKPPPQRSVEQQYMDFFG